MLHTATGTQHTIEFVWIETEDFEKLFSFFHSLPRLMLVYFSIVCSFINTSRADPSERHAAFAFNIFPFLSSRAPTSVLTYTQHKRVTKGKCKKLGGERVLKGWRKVKLIFIKIIYFNKYIQSPLTTFRLIIMMHQQIKISFPKCGDKQKGKSYQHELGFSHFLPHKYTRMHTWKCPPTTIANKLLLKYRIISGRASLARTSRLCMLVVDNVVGCYMPGGGETTNLYCTYNILSMGVSIYIFLCVYAIKRISTRLMEN